MEPSSEGTRSVLSVVFILVGILTILSLFLGSEGFSVALMVILALLIGWVIHQPVEKPRNPYYYCSAHEL